MTGSKLGEPPALGWTEDGRPKALLFDDSYFAPDPVAESRLVFLTGCGLPNAWSVPGGPARIGETGFGTGLNFLLTWQAWNAADHAPDTLDFVSIEAYPLSLEQLIQSHRGFAELEPYCKALQSRWPDRFEPGLHQFSFDDGRVRLSLIIGEAAQLAKAVVPGGVEAWFLDGFAPSRNPDMWRDDLFEAIAGQSAPGARLASFTAAGIVRRGLEAVGFQINREPGFAGKRHRITGELMRVPSRPWWFVEASPSQHVTVKGAGVAGLCAAHALKQSGCAVYVCDPAGLGAGASGNVAALVMPRVHIGGGAEGGLLNRYFDTAHDLWTRLGVLEADGVDQRPSSDRDPDRFARFAEQSEALWDGSVLHHPRAGYVRPKEALKALWPHDISKDPQPGLLLDAIGAALEPEGEAWPLAYRAGQAICVAADALPNRPLVAGEFVVPLAYGTAMIGASFTPHEGASPPPWDEAIEQRLLAHAAALGVEVTQVLSRWSGVRVTLPDRLPALGPSGDGWRITGLGARGFVTAPLLGALFADCVTGRVLPVLAEQWQLIHAGRFLDRAKRRQQG